MPIDAHAHYIPQSLVAAVRERGSQIGVRLRDAAGSKTPALEFSYGFKVRPFFPKLVESVEERTAWLDEQNLDVQLVATWPDIYGYGLPRDQSVSWHRILNDTLGHWCRDHSTRFGFVASLPLPNGDDAAQELERAISLGAVAVMISANVEGTNIGELSLDALWAKAERLNLPVLIHPILAGPAPRAAKFALAQSTQYTFDTTLGIGSLLFSGVLDRFPQLTFVLSHGGGAYPYLAGRFDIMHTRMDRAAQADVAQKAPSAYAPMMAYDTIVHAPKALRFLADLVGIDRLVLGTDYSFPPADLQPLDGLRTAGFSVADVGRIADENPRRLFSRLGV
ncbi:MAG: amidohydrolase family protein [Xanthobacteraceae bacterium]|jgi:aminocarboxymuconate-semialdehyde decarboxylase